uniref:Uncharacterized protein OSJNBa0051M20.110 n=1 Tax=Oryza sativa subsp. japonica TaxID=39947 RepID=Q69S13_ORYSJ|nr:hypothetical protein [Oryza sativa Japonica Group]
MAILILGTSSSVLLHDEGGSDNSLSAGGSSPFILVVDFVRFNFRLTVKSVAIALQACLGGSPHGFSVLSLKANCFSFQVCNKNVGLYVNSFRDFTCKDFHVRFFLWGNGGPNWRREFDLWEKEENDLWAHLHDADFRPELFLLEGTNIEVPWEGRTPRADLTLQGVLPNSHQEFAAVVVDPQPPEHLFGQLIQEVANIIEHQHHIHVVRIQRYPLALCLVQLPSVLDRDILVASGPVLLGSHDHHSLFGIHGQQPKPYQTLHDKSD